MNTLDPITTDLVYTQKIYKTKMIQVATFLGGPLVAGYLIAANYKAFNEAHKTRRVWLYASVATIVILAGSFTLPENTPRYLIPLLYSWATAYLVEYCQGKQIVNHHNAGGQDHTWGRVVLIGLIGAVITFGCLFIIAFLADPLFS